MDRKFAIFDMDGTLVDSMAYWCGLGREYLRGQGLDGPTARQVEDMKTMTMEESSAYIAQAYGLSFTPQQIAADMTQRMVRHYRTDVPLKPGVAAYLDKLKADGVRCCVASATDTPLIRDCLTRLGVADRFEFMLSCSDVGAGKSSPLVYLTAARMLGAEPRQVAVFEDALRAVHTARDAGFYVVGVYDAATKGQWPQVAALSDEAMEIMGTSLPR